MLRIGYVRLRDSSAHEDSAALKASGCQVVRAEAAADGAALSRILEFIGPGDELVVTRLSRLAITGRELLEIVEQLDAREAALTVLQPQLSSLGPDGHALRAVLEAVAELEPVRRRRSPGVQEICALQRAGVGPVEIARRLGVSRMTVWRRLKALEGLGT